MYNPIAVSPFFNKRRSFSNASLHWRRNRLYHIKKIRKEQDRTATVPQFLLSYFLLSWIDLSDTTEKEEQGQKGLSKSRGRPDKK
jgi:hypothetical protein